MNIVLVGMPGCGKSTVGVVLAKAAGMNFCDTDLVIQKINGKKLQDIINKVGNEEFYRYENDAILTVDCDDTVIATGGSAVYSDAAMKWLKKNGVVVYLCATADEIAKRLSDFADRGIAIGAGMSIYDLYEQRRPLYEKYADITIDEGGLTISQLVAKILSALADFNK